MKLRDLKKLVSLNEVLIVLGKKRYPKFNTVVILAGGAGSGKGFVLSNLVGVEGRVFDVDAIKSLSLVSTKISADILESTGIDIKKLQLTKPDDVSLLHKLIKTRLNLPGKQKDIAFASAIIGNPGRKPNLILISP